MKRIKTRPFDCVCVFFQTFDITPPDSSLVLTLTISKPYWSADVMRLNAARLHGSSLFPFCLRIRVTSSSQRGKRREKKSNGLELSVKADRVWSQFNIIKTHNWFLLLCFASTLKRQIEAFDSNNICLSGCISVSKGGGFGSNCMWRRRGVGGACEVCPRWQFGQTPWCSLLRDFHTVPPTNKGLIKARPWTRSEPVLGRTVECVEGRGGFCAD